MSIGDYFRNDGFRGAPARIFDVLVGSVHRVVNRIHAPRPPLGSPGWAREMSRREWAIVLGILFLALVLHVWFAFRYPVDSDEPQHLHIAWAWTQGLLQYRDVFDNHTPLFHMLCAIIPAVLGERADILLFSRLAMIPLWGIALWITYVIGRSLFSERAGAWAAALTALFPSSFVSSVEFRTDNLWNVFWLLSVAILLSGPISKKRCFCAGLFLGAAFGVSMKTMLLLASVILAGLATLAVSVVYGEKGRGLDWGLMIRCGGSFFLGTAIIPAALVLFFFWKGAFSEFLYGTVQHNIVPGLGRWSDHRLHRLIFPVCAVMLWWPASCLYRAATREGAAAGRVFILFLAGAYIVLMETFWPLVTVQNFLPVMPFLLMALIPFFLMDFPRGRVHAVNGPSPRGLMIPLCFAAMEITALLALGRPWTDRMHGQEDLLQEVLSLTDREDRVMDLKGEMIFRRRAAYYVFETITEQRYRSGLIVDDIPERMAGAGTFVAAADDLRFPPRTRSFLRENFLPVGNLRVAGRFLPVPSGVGHPIVFDVVIPGSYAIVCRDAMVQGLLDGRPYTGPTFLNVGRHELIPAFHPAPLALIWAKAPERGFFPFDVRGMAQ